MCMCLWCICCRVKLQEESLFKEKEQLRSQLEATMEAKAKLIKVPLPYALPPPSHLFCCVYRRMRLLLERTHSCLGTVTPSSAYSFMPS